MSPSMMASILLHLLGSALAQSADPTPADTRIDRVVSVVGDAIVTDSDLRLEAELLRYDTVSCPALAAPQKDLLGLLEERRVLHRLGAGRPLYLPSSTAVAKRLNLLSQNMGAEFEAFKSRWGLNPKQLEKLIRDRMMEEAYVNANLGRSLKAEQTAESENWESHYRQAYRPWIQARKEGMPIRRLPNRKP
jgi:hypothetical protein